MARHPEVKEKEIIEAALALELKGKTPNPGAIRASLGFRGGLIRIRDVWDTYYAKRGAGYGEINNEDLSLDDLPSDISDAAIQMISRQREQLEFLIINAYRRCQKLYEKRADDLTLKHEESLLYYREYEASADQSIKLLETDISELQAELKVLAKQNASLLIENSKLSGQVAAFEVSLPNAITQKSGTGAQSLNPAK
jgi:hypothetical protein